MSSKNVVKNSKLTPISTWDAAGDKIPYGGLTNIVLSIGGLIIIL
ncbi:MAG: hypothetical protein WBE61_10015 [Nitrososphaeraceae archaeon]